MKIKYIFLLLLFSSCKKFLEVNPPVTKADASVVYQSDGTAIAVMNGIYTDMSKGSSAINGIDGISVFAGLSADEFQTSSSSASTLQMQAYANSLTKLDVPMWTAFFQYIYTCNAIIKGLEASSTLSAVVKQQLLGEAKFTRAFCYFYLTGFFGDVPLLTTTDYRVSTVSSRTPKAEVYQQMIKDLKEAQQLLSPAYLAVDLKSGTNERTRPNIWTATALLARVFLYNADYANASIEADKIIARTELYGLSDLDQVFHKNNKEAIWQLQPVEAGYNSADGHVFVLTSEPNGQQPLWLSQDLYNFFEANDLRKKAWIGTFTSESNAHHFVYKYKNGLYDVGAAVSEYETVFRLAEVMLIRAESRVQLNDPDGARKDINTVRNRAGLEEITSTDKSFILNAIARERRLELFAEFGHRWFDLKRTGKVNEVMSAFAANKDAIWTADDQLYPIPQSDILLNKNLSQNHGY
jgi:hypothetical protein